MSPEIVRKQLSASPFRPFALGLNSGQVVTVPHPDFAFMPPKPNAWDIVVYDEDQTFAIIDLAQVATMKELRPAKRAGPGNRKRQATG